MLVMKMTLLDGQEKSRCPENRDEHSRYKKRHWGRHNIQSFVTFSRPLSWCFYKAKGGGYMLQYSPTPIPSAEITAT